MLHALDTVRSGMPSARNAVYLNAGTWGPLPTRAADAMRARVDAVESHGRIGTAGYEQFTAVRESARAALAEAVASAPERIALTHSTSGGINLVLGGLAFARGDEVVTTDNEHAGLLEPLGALRRRFGIEVRVAEVLQGADALDAVTSLIGPRTKLVALSHVLWANGRVLPLRPISDAAHAAGAAVLVDGAQGAGAIGVDPAALGADAYAGPGQKWLCGPNGVGFLWVAEGFEDQFEVAAASYYTRDFRSEGAAVLAGRPAPRRRLAEHRRACGPGRRGRVPPRARRLERGRGAYGGGARADASPCWPAGPRGDGAGRQRGCGSARRVHGRGHGRRGRRHGARGRGVLARSLPGLDWVRVSLGYWLSESDLERLGDALRALARWSPATSRSRASDGGARAGRLDDRPRRRRDARLHARGHARDRQGRRPARARGARRPDHPRQHLPPALPARRRR